MRVAWKGSGLGANVTPNYLASRLRTSLLGVSLDTSNPKLFPGSKSTHHILANFRTALPVSLLN